MKLLIYVFLLVIPVSFAYDLSDRDWSVVDNLVEAIDERIIEPGYTTPEKLIDRLIYIYETRNYSSRLLAIIDEVIYELEYIYEDEIDWGNDILTEADCFEDEYYDPEEQWCFLIEEQDFDWEGEPTHIHEGESEAILRFEVKDTSLEKVLDNANAEQESWAQETWETIVQIFPEDIREDVRIFEVSDDENSDAAAHVEQISGDPERWALGINLATFYPDGNYDPTESIYTLIHEFGHLVTLDNSQVHLIDADISDAQYERLQSKCQTIFLQEGCLKKDAYLRNFIDTFWSQKDLDVVWSEDGGDVYSGNESDYVTDYAATNPGEDIAESFAHYVLKQKTNHPKVRFFESSQVIERMAHQIRKGIQSTK